MSQVKLSHVTILIQESKKNKVSTNTISDDSGWFEITSVPFKAVQLTFTFSGFKTKTIHLSVTSPQTIDLGQIQLVSLIKQLKEVRVSARKQVIEQDLDKITYNVEADPDSKTETAMDILRKIPLLSLDVNDNLQLNGNSNFQVFINGKPSSLFLHSQNDVFRNMPASMMKTIEVITVPSSRYETEGIGGIINITTYKKSIGGYNGGINFRAGNPKAYSASGNANFTSGKLSLSGNYSYSTGTSPTNSSTLYRQDKTHQNRLEQLGSSNNNNWLQNWGSELSYELNSFNLLSVGFAMNSSKGENNYLQRVALLNAIGEQSEAYKNVIAGNSISNGKDFSLDYQHSFKNDAQQLTLSYRWSNSTSSSNSNFTLQPLVNFKGQASTTSNEEVFDEQTFQLDYAQPIKKHMLELGASVIRRQNNSDYFYKNRDLASGAFVLDTSQSNNFNYGEDIYAGYISLNLRMGKWGLKAGARAEQAKVNAHFVSSGTGALQEYRNVIPNITLSRQLKGMSIVNLSYTQRLQRPDLYYLNPYVDLTDPYNISYGNPALKPSLAHIFNLAYNTFFKKTSININATHQFSNNSIQQFTLLGADTIARTTFGNIGKSKNYNLSLGGNTTLIKNLSISLNGSANYVQYSSTINGKPRANKGLTYNLSGSFNLQLKNWRAGSNISYSAPNILIQGRTASYISNSITVNKLFLKNNKASIGISVSSPFREHRRSFSEINDPAFYLFRESLTIIRRFNLSFNYRFTKVQASSSRKMETP